jgi:hypothetical protein
MHVEEMGLGTLHPRVTGSQSYAQKRRCAKFTLPFVRRTTSNRIASRRRISAVYSMKLLPLLALKRVERYK